MVRSISHGKDPDTIEPTSARRGASGLFPRKLENPINVRFWVADGKPQVDVEDSERNCDEHLAVSVPFAAALHRKEGKSGVCCCCKLLCLRCSADSNPIAPTIVFYRSFPANLMSGSHQQSFSKPRKLVDKTDMAPDPEKSRRTSGSVEFQPGQSEGQSDEPENTKPTVDRRDVETDTESKESSV